MITTHWQPAYTPPKALPRVRKEQNHSFRRAYLLFDRSPSAQRVFNIIKESNGVTQMDLIMKTGLMGVSAYIRTLEADEMIESEQRKLAHSRKLVNHYLAAA